MATCVDLEQQFGRRYRIGWEADGVTKPQWPREDWPWLREIRCRHGLIYPYGGTRLAACMEGHPRVARRLKRLPAVQRTARGELDELVAEFDVKDAAAILRVMRPYRRRQLSGAERKRLAEAGRRFRFGRSHGAEGGFTAVESTNGAQGDPRAGV